jgi:hypothetical protein
MNTTMRVRLFLAAAGGVTLLACAAPAAAQNVIPNGTFDGGIDGFQPYSGSPPVSYEPSVDLEDEVGSGTLEVADAQVDQAQVAVARRCISGSVPAGPYYFEYWTRFAPGETAGGVASANVFTYPSAGCAGAASNTFTTSPVSVSVAHGRGIWFRLRGGSIVQTAGNVPAGTNSLAIYAKVNKTSGNVLTANFDNFFFAPVGKPLCKGLVPTIGGSDANDVVLGTPEADVIVTFGGDDEVYAGDGDDVVCAGTGDDTVFGEGGKDALFGQGGDDDLYGGEQGDVLKGGPGSDFLSGGGGQDVCLGGGGTNDAADASCEKIKSTP